MRQQPISSGTTAAQNRSLTLVNALSAHNSLVLSLQQRQLKSNDGRMWYDTDVADIRTDACDCL